MLDLADVGGVPRKWHPTLHHDPFLPVNEVFSIPQEGCRQMAPIPHRINIVLCLFKRDGEEKKKEEKKAYVDSSRPLRQSIDTTVAGIIEATVHLGFRPLPQSQCCSLAKKCSQDTSKDFSDA